MTKIFETEDYSIYRDEQLNYFTWSSGEYKRLKDSRAEMLATKYLKRIRLPHDRINVRVFLTQNVMY